MASARAGLSMLFLHRAPRPPLDTFVEAVWLCHQEPRPLVLERVLPTGRAQLIVNLKEDETRLYDPERQYRCVASDGTVLSGVHPRYQIIDTDEQEYVVGVAFKPGGCVPFFKVPAHVTAGLDVPLDELCGGHLGSKLRERLLECQTDESRLDVIETVLEEMWTARMVHPAVAFALDMIHERPHATSISAITDAIGMSAKRFIERFKSDIGLTPKHYCRIQRFQRAVSRAHQGRQIDWAEVALDCGYFDQAHFIHDFRSFAGVTPTSYHAARTPFQNHVKFLQSNQAAV
jgi:AraC-like DNA-binding protein